MPRRQCAPSPPKAQQNDVEPPLRNDVVALDRGLEDMIWRIVSRFSELASRPLAVPNDVARAFFDGMFQQALLKLLAGGGPAAADLQANVETALDRLVLAWPG